MHWLAAQMAVPGGDPTSQGGTATPEAFGLLYRENVGRIYAYVRYRVASTQEAEDLTADIFEAALKSFPAYRPEKGSPQTWLFAIARNRLSHHFRAQRVRRFLRLEAADEEQAREPQPEELVQELELSVRVRELMSSLGTRERELLALKFGAGMNNREIAALTGLSESNVGTLVYRSLQRLRQGMAGDGDV
jgi:RNA polymerase sigma-70 factor (ECF subfamily)